MGRILGIDYGTARVGLAISDPLKITAQSMDTIEISSDEDAINRIIQIVHEKGVDDIVIGYPRHMDGRKSEIAERVDKIIEALEKEKINIKKWDERLTTVMAHKTMRELNIKQKERKVHADRLAAMYILEDYMRTL